MLTSILSISLLILSQSIANDTYNEIITLEYSEQDVQILHVAASEYQPIIKESWLLDMIYPVDDYENTTSGFGSRNLECSRCSTYHKGLDFTPGRGAPVYAVMDGVISQVQRSGEYGVHVIITHEIHPDLVYTTVYAHLQVSNVTNLLQLDNVINKGDVIGFVGNTGLSTGPHLHFEIRKNGVHLDPVRIFEKNMAEPKS